MAVCIHSVKTDCRLNYCFAGHYERKMKHLENQKESKRRMKRIGSVDLPQEAFFDILSTKAK